MNDPNFWDRHDRWYWPRALVAILVAMGAIGACSPTRSPKEQVQAVVAPLSKDEALTDTREPLTRTIPAKPERWQKTEGCDEDAGEEKIRGACYAHMARKPPCGAKLLEHNGGCYRAIAKPDRKPTSIER